MSQDQSKEQEQEQKQNEQDKSGEQSQEQKLESQDSSKESEDGSPKSEPEFNIKEELEQIKASAPKKQEQGHNFDRGLQKLQEKIASLEKTINSASQAGRKKAEKKPLEGAKDDEIVSVKDMKEVIGFMREENKRLIEQLQTSQSSRQVQPEPQVSNDSIVQGVQELFDIPQEHAEFILQQALPRMEQFAEDHPGMTSAIRDMAAKSFLREELDDLNAKIAKVRGSKKDSGDEKEVRADKKVTEKGSSTTTNHGHEQLDTSPILSMNQARERAIRKLEAMNKA